MVWKQRRLVLVLKLDQLVLVLVLVPVLVLVLVLDQLDQLDQLEVELDQLEVELDQLEVELDQLEVELDQLELELELELDQLELVLELVQGMETQHQPQPPRPALTSHAASLCDHTGRGWTCSFRTLRSGASTSALLATLANWQRSTSPVRAAHTVNRVAARRTSTSTR